MRVISSMKLITWFKNVSDNNGAVFLTHRYSWLVCDKRKKKKTVPSLHPIPVPSETSKLVETSASLNWCFKPLFNVLQIKKFVKYQTNPKKSYPKSRREAGQLGWAYRRHFISISYVSQNHIFVFVVICRIINVLNSLKTKNLWRAISLELIGGWGWNP